LPLTAFIFSNYMKTSKFYFIAVFTLMGILAFSGCKASYPKSSVTESIQDLIKKEYDINGRAKLTGDTLYLDVSLEGLVSPEQKVVTDILKKIQGASLVITRVSLSSDAKIKFMILVASEPTFNLHLRIIQKLDDVKAFLYQKISKADYEDRLVLEIEKNDDVDGILNNGPFPYRTDEIDVESARQELLNDDKVSVLLIQKTCRTKEAVGSLDESQLVAAFNEVLDMPDLYKLVDQDALQFDPNRSALLKKIIERLNGPPEPADVRTVNRAILFKIYPHTLAKTHTNATEENREIGMKEFVGRLIVSQVNMITRSNPFLAVTLGNVQLRYIDFTEDELTIGVSNGISKTVTPFFEVMISSQSLKISKKYAGWGPKKIRLMGNDNQSILMDVTPAAPVKLK